ncbi:uncharacterized protein TNCV_3239801 [Trichonephila clavipes]|nr:uncharacterized protein TNCV_3239801 [Trichonephila clavipes]
MDGCKYALPLRHGGSLNSHRAASPLMRLVGREERWDAPDHPLGVLSQNWNGTEPKYTITCIELKAAANDRQTSSPSPR